MWRRWRIRNIHSRLPFVHQIGDHVSIQINPHTRSQTYKNTTFITMYIPVINVVIVDNILVLENNIVLFDISSHLRIIFVF